MLIDILKQSSCILFSLSIQKNKGNGWDLLFENFHGELTSNILSNEPVRQLSDCTSYKQFKTTIFFTAKCYRGGGGLTAVDIIYAGIS